MSALLVAYPLLSFQLSLVLFMAKAVKLVEVLLAVSIFPVVVLFALGILSVEVRGHRLSIRKRTPVVCLTLFIGTTALFFLLAAMTFIVLPTTSIFFFATAALFVFTTSAILRIASTPIFLIPLAPVFLVATSAIFFITPTAIIVIPTHARRSDLEGG